MEVAIYETREGIFIENEEGIWIFNPYTNEFHKTFEVETDKEPIFTNIKDFIKQYSYVPYQKPVFIN